MYAHTVFFSVLTSHRLLPKNASKVACEVKRPELCIDLETGKMFE